MATSPETEPIIRRTPIEEATANGALVLYEKHPDTEEVSLRFFLPDQTKIQDKFRSISKLFNLLQSPKEGYSLVEEFGKLFAEMLKKLEIKSGRVFCWESHAVLSHLEDSTYQTLIDGLQKKPFFAGKSERSQPLVASIPTKRGIDF